MGPQIQIREPFNNLFKILSLKNKVKEKKLNAN